MSVSTVDDRRIGARLDRLEHMLERVTRPLSTLGVLGMLVAAGATVVDVLLRSLFNSGVAALNEIIAVAFAVAVAACIPAGMARGVGIRVDVVEGLMTKKVAAWLKAFGSALLLLFVSILCYRMGIYAAGLAAGERTTVVLNLPLSPFLWSTTILLGVSALVQALMTLVAAYRAHAIGVREKMTAVSIGAIALCAVIAVLFLFGLFKLDVLSHFVQARPAFTVIVALLLMWLCLLALIPLAAVMGLLGVAGCGLFIGFQPAMSAAATEAAGFLTSYQVASLPLFLLMGSFAAVSGISRDVYELAQAALGRFRGGLAMATIGGCAGFGAVTGSSLATVATFGRVALPQMQERRYSPEFAAGCVAAGGTLGALIPPSSPLIIFALLTEASIGQLFVAAIVPGLIATALYLLAIVVSVRVRPSLVPPAEKPERGAVLAALKNCGAVTLLFGTVIGGMYSGVFTATEAAAVGAFVAFVISLLRGKLRGAEFWSVMVDTTLSTAMIYTLVFGVLAFSFFVGVSGLPEMASTFVGTLQLSPVAVLAIILLIFLVLGCIMDSFTVMVITVPILTPLVLHLGYDLVWWGIINLVVVEMGLVTPPFGLHLFVLKSMVPEVPLERIYVGVLPFCIADFFKLALLLLFPILTLWLPLQMTP